MSDDQRTPPSTSTTEEVEYFPDNTATEVREVNAITSPSPSSSTYVTASGSVGRRPESWSGLSAAGSDVENFTTMSREFNALLVAGSTLQATTDPISDNINNNNDNSNLGRIREEEPPEETNPLAIVPDSIPVPSPQRLQGRVASTLSLGDNTDSIGEEAMSLHRVKKEEVESKIGAWQTAEIAKINNRFKREDVFINGWENEQVEKATAWLKKVERKLDEQRARAMERKQNDVAKARRKAEEKKASAEAKRGTKVARILEMSNLLRAVGRAPSKRYFF